MLSMYFLVVLLNGIFTSQIRRIEKQAMLKEEKLKRLGFYNTLFRSISHELRTPITTIIGVSENILNPDTNITDTERIELNREVLTAGERLNQLVENLLNMSRIESGFLRANKTWCDVTELVYTAINRIPENFSHRNINVVLPKKMLLVKLDFGLIEQALYNVIHNAVLHTPDKSMVEVTADFSNKLLKITVEDDGPGFNFTNIDLQKNDIVQKNKNEGLGLGLSIVNGFLTMHGGTLNLSNNANGGASVQLNIPVETTEWRENDDE